MAPIITKASTAKAGPRILVVDDEPMLIELVDDVIARHLPCQILSAHNIADAKKILQTNGVELLVADVKLPDGDGTSLLGTLQHFQPCASAIVITGEPSLDGAINAMRQGALDFLPKPFTAEQLVERVKRALQRQDQIARREKRIGKLRDAVRKLNEARRLVSKKVDLLCNDLITAYGELSRQFDIVRVQEGFRKTLTQSNDLEQMLCHTMDWLLRQLGYSNVAIWLASETEEFQLGAYMKYTIPGEPPLTKAMSEVLVPIVTREGFIHYSGGQSRELLEKTALSQLSKHTILACNCTYLGEPLASIIMFRDESAPFSEDDAAALRCISPIFATSLAGIVRDNEKDDDGGGSDFWPDEPDNKPKKPSKRDEADWWKRGEVPPF